LIFGSRPMKTCRMTGSPALAVSPSVPLLVGTFAPAEKPLTFLAHDGFKRRLTLPPRLGIRREKDQPAAILLLVRQGDLRLVAGLLHEAMRHLHQDARAVASVVLTTAGAAVTQVDENGSARHERWRGISYP